MPDIVQRLCKKCQTSYPLTSEFWYKDKKASEGLAYICKNCAKAKAIKWHYENQEYANEVSRTRYETHQPEVKQYLADNAERIAQAKREWRQNNPDKVAAQKKRHYDKYKTKIFAYHRSWYKKNKKRITAQITPEQRKAASARSCAWAKANPDKVRNYRHLRRARKLGNGGEGYTKADKNLQLRSQKGLCWWCTKPMGLDITEDHIIPIKLGGKHEPRNIVLCHLSCNCSKKDKLPQDWIGRLF